MKPASPGAPYTVPPEPSRTPAILLALGVHAVLLAFLYFGISWQSKTPISVEAEVWDMKVETAAAPPLPAPAPEPEPQPEPEPTPAPPPPPPPVPKVVEPEPVKPAAPDIALQREKERKLEQAKKEREREIAEQKKREEREEQKQKELAEQKRRDDIKDREEQKKRELAEQKKKEDEKKKLDEKKLAAEKAEKAEKAEADKKQKLAAEKAAKAKAEAAEKAQLDKLRDLELKRIAGAAGSTGNAQKSSAPKLDSGYQAAIAAKVKSNTVYNGDEPGNPTVEFRIEQLPTGEILSVRKSKSSGVPAFDEAVERGIIKSSPLPKKKDGTVERTFPLVFKLKDLQ